MSPDQLEPPLVKLTCDDYLLFPDDGKWREFINGRPYVNASPVPPHQRVIAALMIELYSQLTPHGHTVLTAPINVQLSESDVVVPDLVVVASDNDIITDTRIIGAPDVIVEIRPPSTRKNDGSLKRRLYEQTGVPEYWIVDPDAHSVTVLRMKDGRYGSAEPSSDELTTTIGPTPVAVDLKKIW